MGLAPVILAARELDYRYAGGVHALRGLTLAVRRGVRLALLGANGCGKTTLFLHLNGTLRPQRGEILLDGRPAGYDRRALAAWRGRVGLVLQDPDDQLFAATVYQDASFGPLNLGLPEAAARQRVEEALAALDIGPLADRPTHMLSFGQKRRAAIAGILAMRPELLLLDEPMAGLDPQGVVRLRAVLDRLHAEGTTLVLSTHDVDLAYGWAEEVAILDEGRVLCQGAAAEVLADAGTMAAVGLRVPLLLEVALKLRAAGYDWPDGQPPRTREAVADLLRQMRPGRIPAPVSSASGPGPGLGGRVDSRG